MSDDEQPTELPKDGFAVCFTPTTGFELHLPKMDEDKELPGEAVALIAAGMRLQSDEAFRDELLRWWEDKYPQ
ncbi:unnamed protein product [Laminaria digitata]